MFNLSQQLEREARRRDAALAQMKHELGTLAGNAAAHVNGLEDAVRSKPWEACAISLGAGLAFSSLLPTQSATAPAQPQRVIIDLRTGQASTEAPARPAAPSILDMVMQGMSLLGALRAPAPGAADAVQGMNETPAASEPSGVKAQ